MGSMKFIPLGACNQKFTFVNKETARNDIIFNAKPLRSNHSIDPVPVNDKDYNKPDHEKYFFSTMGSGVNVMYPNNMVTPIRSKPSLNGYITYNELTRFGINRNELSQGIYIVEYYNMYNDGSANVETIIKYYFEENHIDYSNDIVAAIREQLSNSINRVIDSMIKLRIVTYISKQTIDEFHHIYVPSTDVVITRGDIDNRLIHPSSSKYKENIDNNIEINKHSIVIDIIDNEHAKPYFINLGNETLRLFPTRDYTKEEGVSIKVYKGKDLITDRKSHINTMANDLGIYNTQDAAKTNGDITKLIEIRKLDLEEKKLKLENKKIENDDTKQNKEMIMLDKRHDHESKMMVQKFEIGQLDIAKKYTEQEIMLNKASIDMQMSVSKHKMESAISINKNKHEIHKMQIDQGTKAISILSGLTKIITK
jgi:hypothetical protein